MGDELARALDQLAAARSEIKNLRQQLTSLKHCHRKDVDEIKYLLQTWKCARCSGEPSSSTTSAAPSSSDDTAATIEETPFRTIGHIETGFQLKRGLPRQPGILSQSRGVVRLMNNERLTNPDHALEGLDHFSHMWVLFHFHANNNTHVRAKVTPPRLNGVRTGVFATRSPHRPCPIGLSLVKIDYIEENCIYFSGVDMIDGTPVLDIKPYIPQYDMPYSSHFASSAVDAASSMTSMTTTTCDTSLINGRSLHWERLPRESDGRSEDGDSILQDQSDLDIDFQDRLLVGEAAQPSIDRSDELPGSNTLPEETSSARILDGRDSDDVFVNDYHNAPIMNDGDIDRALIQSTSQREAPEGSEGSSPPSPVQHLGNIRVADWIINPSVSRLQVQFSDVCSQTIERISENAESAARLRASIVAILSEDPRSIYIRNRHPSDHFTCMIEGLLVSCVFDDTSHLCLVTGVEETSTSTN